VKRLGRTPSEGLLGKLGLARSRRDAPKQRRCGEIQFRKIRLEELEDRCLLATLEVISSNLMISDTPPSVANDTLTISRSDANIRVSDPNNALTAGPGTTQVNANTVDVPLASITASIQVNTLDGSDTLTVDFSGGNPIPPGGILYNGGAGATDTLTVTGGTTTSVTHTFTNASDGSITVVGALAGVITYTGLEPVTDNLSAADRIFTFNGGAETITLTDAAGANMTIDSTLGESVTFANPTASLTINAGTGNDTVTITSVDANGPFNASLAINGGTGDDTVNLSAGIMFAAGRNLDVDLQNDDAAPGIDRIVVSTNVNLRLAGTGAATLKASRDIRLFDFSSIVTVDGPLTLEANQQASPTISSSTGILVLRATVASIGLGSVTVKGKGGTDGVSVDARGQIVGGTSGTLTVVGTGGSWSGGNIGVRVDGDLFTRITSNGANVSVTGTGGGSGGSSNNIGVWLAQGEITAGAAGTVHVVGIGGNSAAGTGVRVSGTISSGGGQVVVNGTGMGTSQPSVGVDVLLNGRITAGGSAPVFVTGTGGSAASGTGNFGVSVFGASAQITTGGGNLFVTGIEGGGTGGRAIDVASSGTITTATSGGNITLTGNSMNFDSTARIVANSASTVTLEQFTPGVAINLGTQADTIGGPLGLSDFDLDRVNPLTTGNLVIGNANSGTVTISAPITRAVSTVLNINSGAAIDFTTGSLNSAGGNVTLDAGTRVSPATSGVDVNAGTGTRTLAFGSGDDLAIVINGTTVDTQYQQLNVVGRVNVTGVDLVISGSHVPSLGQRFTIVNNDSSDPVIGIFNGPATITNFLGSGLNAIISYTGGDGNDVVLTVTTAKVETTAVEVISGSLVITDIAGGNTNDTLTISRNGANIRITDPNNALEARAGAIQVNANTVDVPAASITGNIQVNTLDGGDVLTLDLSSGNPIPAGNLTYAGAGGSDSLVITGGNQGNVTYNYTGPNDGNIVMQNFGTVFYSGIEPITNTGTAADVVFNLPSAGNVQAILEDDGVSNAFSRLRSSPSVFEQTLFANPNGSLTISRGSGMDDLTINALPDFNAGLTLGTALNPLESINFAGAVSLTPTKSVFASAGTITTNAAVTTPGGGITLRATGDITLNNALISGGGAVSLTADSDARRSGRWRRCSGRQQRRQHTHRGSPWR
jgi:hypothetical protein